MTLKQGKTCSAGINGLIEKPAEEFCRDEKQKTVSGRFFKTVRNFLLHIRYGKYSGIRLKCFFINSMFLSSESGKIHRRTAFRKE